MAEDKFKVTEQLSSVQKPGMSRRSLLKNCGKAAVVTTLLKTKSDEGPPTWEKADYSYEHGLDSMVLLFNANGSITETPEHLEQSHLVISALQRTTRHAFTVPTGHGELECVVFNDHGTGKITVVHQAWGSTFRHPTAEREIEGMAIRDPEMAFLVINSPGVDGSTALPATLSEKLSDTGRYGEFGAYITAALKECLRNYDRIDTVGFSEGARHAIGTAAASHDVLGRGFDEVRVTDPVGSRKESFLALLDEFIIQEGSHAGNYTRASTDPTSAALQAAVDSSQGFYSKMSGLIKRSGVAGTFQQINAMCAGGLREDLAEALPHIRDRLLINSPALSALNNSEDVTALLKDSAVVARRPGIIQQRIMSGRTHAFQSGNPGLYSAILSR